MSAIDPALLEILVCPETKQRVREADAALLGKLNAAIKAGSLKSRDGEAVTEALDGGLVREDKNFVYPIVGGIPVMLIPKAIPLAGIL